MEPGNRKGKTSITNKIPKSSRQQQREGHWLVSIPVLCAALVANKIKKEDIPEALCEKTTHQIGCFHREAIFS